MYATLLTRELTEVSGTRESSLSQLADVEERSKTPLLIATTLQDSEYDNGRNHLIAAGWRSLGVRVNPNTGNLITLWYKQRRHRAPSPARYQQMLHKQGDVAPFETSARACCCGLRIYEGKERCRRPRFLCIERVPNGAKPTRGWKQFAKFRHCSYWTNVREAGA